MACDFGKMQNETRTVPLSTEGPEAVRASSVITQHAGKRDFPSCSAARRPNKRLSSLSRQPVCSGLTVFVVMWDKLETHTMTGRVCAFH